MATISIPSHLDKTRPYPRSQKSWVHLAKKKQWDLILAGPNRQDVKIHKDTFYWNGRKYGVNVVVNSTIHQCPLISDSIRVELVSSLQSSSQVNPSSVLQPNISSVPASLPPVLLTLSTPLLMLTILPNDYPLANGINSLTKTSTILMVSYMAVTIVSYSVMLEAFFPN